MIDIHTVKGRRAIAWYIIYTYLLIVLAVGVPIIVTPKNISLMKETIFFTIASCINALISFALKMWIHRKNHTP